MTFTECVMVCAQQDGLVEQFDRLRGTNLRGMASRHPIETMIDEATGKDDYDLALFIDFVYDCVWMRGDWRSSDTETRET